MPIGLREPAERVAERVLARNMESEDWQKAVAINGLLAMGDEEYVSAARTLVDRAIATQTSEGQFSYGSLDGEDWDGHDGVYRSQTDPAALGRPVLDFYVRTGEDRYLDAATEQYEFLVETAQRTDDGGIAHHRGPVELWVDSMYMICPFLAQYAQTTETDQAAREAVDQIELQAKYLQDPHTDLFRHEWRETPNTFPEDSFWSRGNGWAAAGIIDTLTYLDDTDRREPLVDIFRRLATAVVERQDASGYWHNVLDDPESPLETSGTLMFAYAFQRALKMGLISDDKYREAASLAMGVCTDVVDKNGAVRRVVGPPGGPETSFSITSYGQGWFLLATSTFRE